MSEASSENDSSAGNGQPSPMAANGRRSNGTFAPGHKFAKGNPLATKVQRLRAGLLAAVSVADLRAVVDKLVESAKGGDVAAAKVLFDRCLGPVEALDIMAELTELRAAVDSLLESRSK